MEKKLLSEKPEGSYSKSAIDTIKLVSYRKDDHSHFVGSYSYRAQKYPGDIDALDLVNSYREHGKWENAKDNVKLAKSVTKRLQSIVKSIEEEINTYFIELKAGYDYDVLNFFRPIGNMSNGIFTPDVNLVQKTLEYEKRYPDSAEKMQIVRRYIETPRIDSYDVINLIIRNLYVIRWSADDVKRGYVTLKNGDILTLFDALIRPSYKGSLPLVKMDIVRLVEGSYMEVSNIYMLEYYKDGVLTPMSAFPLAGGITFDVEKYAFSPVYHSAFKCVKRMFAYARFRFLFEKEDDYLAFLNESLEFLSSEVSLVYQIKSELETIGILYERELVSVNSANVNRILDNIKFKLSTVLSLSDTHLKTLYAVIDKAYKAKTVPNKLSKIEDVSKMLKSVVENTAKEWLNARGLNPIPDAYLPTKEMVKDMNKKGQRQDPLLLKQNLRTYDSSHNFY